MTCLNPEMSLRTAKAEDLISMYFIPKSMLSMACLHPEMSLHMHSKSGRLVFHTKSIMLFVTWYPKMSLHTAKAEDLDLISMIVFHTESMLSMTMSCLHPEMTLHGSAHTFSMN